jgi:hypothetical protein
LDIAIYPWANWKMHFRSSKFAPWVHLTFPTLNAFRGTLIEWIHAVHFQIEEFPEDWQLVVELALEIEEARRNPVVTKKSAVH